MADLESLLKVIVSKKSITVNLYDEHDLLIITFILDGYKALDDFLCDDEVIKIEIINLYTLNISIDTSGNA